MDLPEQLKSVQFFFSKLPGVGEKTAMRQTLQITNWNEKERVQFAEALVALNSLNNCENCGFFSSNSVCNYCQDEHRIETRTLCVVESITDFMAIDRSEQYKGLYHILGGVLNPLMGIGPEELKIPQLLKRIEIDKISNIILAINPSVEGDATCSYLRQKISENINVERIGFGIPMGGSLEYLDSLTIMKALENRKSFT